MSDQGWRDPYDQGWQDPYAQQSPGTSPGYGVPGYGATSPGYGAGPPPYPAYGPAPYPYPAPASQGSAVAALVCNIVALVMCCGLISIGGIITSSIAMNRTQTDPESARTLTIWSWVLLGLNFVVAFLIILLVVALDDSSTNSGY